MIYQTKGRDRSKSANNQTPKNQTSKTPKRQSSKLFHSAFSPGLPALPLASTHVFRAALRAPFFRPLLRPKRPFSRSWWPRLPHEETPCQPMHRSSLLLRRVDRKRGSDVGPGAAGASHASANLPYPRRRALERS